MKQKELNKKSDKELIRLRKTLEMDLIKANAGSENIKNKEAKIVSTKGMAQKGIRTSLKKQIRRAIAQINNTMQQRGLSEELDKGKHISKRRERRLRGRKKNGK